MTDNTTEMLLWVICAAIGVYVAALLPWKWKYVEHFAAFFFVQTIVVAGVAVMEGRYDQFTVVLPALFAALATLLCYLSDRKEGRAR